VVKSCITHLPYLDMSAPDYESILVMTGRSSALCGIPHKADYAELSIMWSKWIGLH
jgi:hypothetical protein